MAKGKKFYGSIESLYVRNRETNTLELGGPLREESWNHIRFWDFTEKINGMNISVVITHEGYTVRGRTSTTQFNQSWIDGILAVFPSHEFAVEFFQLNEESAPIIFYGEGYGAGIQKGGHYRPDPSFRAFDLQFATRFVNDATMREIADELGIPTVPYLGRFELPDVFDKAFMDSVIPQSIVAFEDSGSEGVEPEGIVARPPVPLYDEYMRRVILKMTNREFR